MYDVVRLTMMQMTMYNSAKIELVQPIIYIQVLHFCGFQSMGQAVGLKGL